MRPNKERPRKDVLPDDQKAWFRFRFKKKDMYIYKWKVATGFEIRWYWTIGSQWLPLDAKPDNIIETNIGGT